MKTSSPSPAARYATAILEALNELPEGRAVPEGFIYTALMGVMDLDTYYRIVGVLRDAGFLENTGRHQLALTAKGRALFLKQAEVAQ